MSAEVAALSTIVQVKRALGNIGQPPSEGNDVKGEETDSLVTTVGGSLIAMVCVGAIVSGGTSFILGGKGQCLLHEHSLLRWLTYMEYSCFVFVSKSFLCPAALSMVMTASVLVDVASITLFALAPYAVYQKYQLAELGGMRGQMNDLRQVCYLMCSDVIGFVGLLPFGFWLRLEQPTLLRMAPSRFLTSVYSPSAPFSFLQSTNEFKAENDKLTANVDALEASAAG